MLGRAIIIHSDATELEKQLLLRDHQHRETMGTVGNLVVRWANALSVQERMLADHHAYSLPKEPAYDYADRKVWEDWAIIVKRLIKSLLPTKAPVADVSCVFTKAQYNRLYPFFLSDWAAKGFARELYFVMKKEQDAAEEKEASVKFTMNQLMTLLEIPYIQKPEMMQKDNRKHRDVLGGLSAQSALLKILDHQAENAHVDTKKNYLSGKALHVLMSWARPSMKVHVWNSFLADKSVMSVDGLAFTEAVATTKFEKLYKCFQAIALHDEPDDEHDGMQRQLNRLFRGIVEQALLALCRPAVGHPILKDIIKGRKSRNEAGNVVVYNQVEFLKHYAEQMHEFLCYMKSQCLAPTNRTPGTDARAKTAVANAGKSTTVSLHNSNKSPKTKKVVRTLLPADVHSRVLTMKHSAFPEAPFQTNVDVAVTHVTAASSAALAIIQDKHVRAIKYSIADEQRAEKAVELAEMKAALGAVEAKRLDMVQRLVDNSALTGGTEANRQVVWEAQVATDTTKAAEMFHVLPIEAQIGAMQASQAKGTCPKELANCVDLGEEATAEALGQLPEVEAARLMLRHEENADKGAITLGTMGEPDDESADPLQHFKLDEVAAIAQGRVSVVQEDLETILDVVATNKKLCDGARGESEKEVLAQRRGSLEAQAAVLASKMAACGEAAGGLLNVNFRADWTENQWDDVAKWHDMIDVQFNLNGPQAGVHLLNADKEGRSGRFSVWHERLLLVPAKRVGGETTQENDDWVETIQQMVHLQESCQVEQFELIIVSAKLLSCDFGVVSLLDDPAHQYRGTVGESMDSELKKRHERCALAVKNLFKCLKPNGRLLFTLDPTLSEPMSAQQMRLWRALVEVDCQCVQILFQPGDNAKASTPSPYGPVAAAGEADLCYREGCVDVYVATKADAKRLAVLEACVDTTSVGDFGCTRQSWMQQLAGCSDVGLAQGGASPRLDAYTTAVVLNDAGLWDWLEHESLLAKPNVSGRRVSSLVDRPTMWSLGAVDAGTPAAATSVLPVEWMLIATVGHDAWDNVYDGFMQYLFERTAPASVRQVLELGFDTGDYTKKLPPVNTAKDVLAGGNNEECSKPKMSKKALKKAQKKAEKEKAGKANDTRAELLAKKIYDKETIFTGKPPEVLQVLWQKYAGASRVFDHDKDVERADCEEADEPLAMFRELIRDSNRVLDYHDSVWFKGSERNERNEAKFDNLEEALVEVVAWAEELEMKEVESVLGEGLKLIRGWREEVEEARGNGEIVDTEKKGMCKLAFSGAAAMSRSNIDQTEWQKGCKKMTQGARKVNAEVAEEEGRKFLIFVQDVACWFAATAKLKYLDVLAAPIMTCLTEGSEDGGWVGEGTVHTANGWVPTRTWLGINVGTGEIHSMIFSGNEDCHNEKEDLVPLRVCQLIASAKARQPEWFSVEIVQRWVDLCEDVVLAVGALVRWPGLGLMEAAVSMKDHVASVKNLVSPGANRLKEKYASLGGQLTKLHNQIIDGAHEKDILDGTQPVALDDTTGKLCKSFMAMLGRCTEKLEAALGPISNQKFAKDMLQATDGRQNDGHWLPTCIGPEGAEGAYALVLEYEKLAEEEASSGKETAAWVKLASEVVTLTGHVARYMVALERYDNDLLEPVESRSSVAGTALLRLDEAVTFLQEQRDLMLRDPEQGGDDAEADDMAYLVLYDEVTGNSRHRTKHNVTGWARGSVLQDRYPDALQAFADQLAKGDVDYKQMRAIASTHLEAQDPQRGPLCASELVKYNEEMPDPESRRKFVAAVQAGQAAFKWRVAEGYPTDCDLKYNMAFGGRHHWLLHACGLIVAVALQATSHTVSCASWSGQAKSLRRISLGACSCIVMGRHLRHIGVIWWSELSW